MSVEMCSRQSKIGETGRRLTEKGEDGKADTNGNGGCIDGGEE